MSDLASQIKQLEALRVTLPADAAKSIDEAIAALRARQRIEASDGGVILNPSQTIVQGDQHIHPPAHDPALPRQERTLVDYLRALQHECSPLQLSRIDATESRHRRPMRLEQVYIGVHTTSQVELS